ncbi:hypothetical protein K435DRAFT_843047 [Dendrothele bispora CBS 962.96]|uniref:Uncharacterized protein n=1 Tax=Dendrothele bispora (strain CBS 962.96) TaxID=1314807 RepID=A0A4S8LAY4_DENBC|nr:hypothetical protein K435DRAFT_843047 [Dendrothele bispora CBS 962.96]
MPIASMQSEAALGLAPDLVPLRAPRSFDLEAATARADSLRDEAETDVEKDGEDKVWYTVTELDSGCPLLLIHSNTPQTGPVRGKDARTQHFTAPTRVKYEERRLKLEQEASEGIPSTLESVDQKRVNSSHPLMTSGYNVESTRVGCNSWTGPRVEGEETPISLEDLIQKKNMTLCSWDGKSCRPITDSQERVIAVLAGRPETENWDGLMSDAAMAIARTRDQLRFSDKQLNNGRGESPAVTLGVSHGGGRKHPSQSVSEKNHAVRNVGDAEALANMLQNSQHTMENNCMNDARTLEQTYTCYQREEEEEEPATGTLQGYGLPKKTTRNVTRLDNL